MISNRSQLGSLGGIAMKKGLTELVFILDRSGSMAGLESDTIGGFNGMLKKQQKVSGEAVVTTVLFDDRYELLHDRIPIEGISMMTEEAYYVRGCTALYDAIGRTIEKIQRVQENTKEEMQAEKVIFVITTDGCENASRHYDEQAIKKMIDRQKERSGWEFIFLGANMDAVKEAARFGITEDRAVTYENDEEGVQLNYEVIAETISEMRYSAAPISRKWKEKIERRKS